MNKDELRKLGIKLQNLSNAKLSLEERHLILKTFTHEELSLAIEGIVQHKDENNIHKSVYNAFLGLNVKKDIFVDGKVNPEYIKSIKDKTGIDVSYIKEQIDDVGYKILKEIISEDETLYDLLPEDIIKFLPKYDSKLIFILSINLLRDINSLITDYIQRYKSLINIERITLKNENFQNIANYLSCIGNHAMADELSKIQYIPISKSELYDRFHIDSRNIFKDAFSKLYKLQKEKEDLLFKTNKKQYKELETIANIYADIILKQFKSLVQ